MITNGDSTVTVMVDGVPYEAGIDAYNKLIDRVPSDNRRRVSLRDAPAYRSAGVHE